MVGACTSKAVASNLRHSLWNQWVCEPAGAEMRKLARKMVQIMCIGAVLYCLIRLTTR